MKAPIDALGGPTSYCICLPAPLSNHSKHIVKNLTRLLSCSDVKFFKNLDDYNIIIFKIGNKTNNLAIRILQKLSRA